MDRAKQQVVLVQFPNHTTQYTYLLPEGMTAEVGDVAVVDSPHSGITTASIVRVEDSTGFVREATKPIEGVVSYKTFRDIKARVEEEKTIRARLDALLEARIRDNKYAVLADNAEARDLMNQLGILP